MSPESRTFPAFLGFSSPFFPLSFLAPTATVDRLIVALLSSFLFPPLFSIFFSLSLCSFLSVFPFPVAAPAAGERKKRSRGRPRSPRRGERRRLLLIPGRPKKKEKRGKWNRKKDKEGREEGRKISASNRRLFRGSRPGSILFPAKYFCFLKLNRGGACLCLATIRTIKSKFVFFLYSQKFLWDVTPNHRVAPS